MANEMITSLPVVSAAQLTDIICAVQGYSSPTALGTSVQETLQQVLSLITPGTNISVAFVGGSLMISAIGVPGIGYTQVTGTSATMSADNIYGANNASPVTLLLPTLAAAGSLIYVWGEGAGGWTITQNAGQSIKVAPSSSTTVGVTGSLSSTGQYDTVTLGCIVANSTWSVNAMTGLGLTIV
jgi:hypothetical protein